MFSSFIFILISCGIRPNNTESDEEQPIVFIVPSIQDSLFNFIHSIDSFPASSILPEYLVQFRQKENGDTMILMAANENISPSWELNSFPDICKYKYSPIGGIQIGGKNILIRTIDDFDVSGIVNKAILDTSLGKSIDSIVVETNKEPYALSTYKLYRLEKSDSLILLKDYYLGEERLNLENPDFHW